MSLKVHANQPDIRIAAVAIEYDWILPGRGRTWNEMMLYLVGTTYVEQK